MGAIGPEPQTISELIAGGEDTAYCAWLLWWSADFQYQSSYPRMVYVSTSTVHTLSSSPESLSLHFSKVQSPSGLARLEETGGGWRRLEEIGATRCKHWHDCQHWPGQWGSVCPVRPVSRQWQQSLLICHGEFRQSEYQHFYLDRIGYQYLPDAWCRFSHINWKHC